MGQVVRSPTTAGASQSHLATTSRPLSVCLGEGLNPLCTTSTLSEDEVEAWIDKVLDDMKYPLPLHADLEALIQEAEALGEEHADLLMGRAKIIR